MLQDEDKMTAEIDRLIARSIVHRQRLDPGTQIAYFPDHVLDNLANEEWPDYSLFSHDEIEFGFLTRDNGQSIFCRYWITINFSDDESSSDDRWQYLELRTKANSEKTPWANLILIETVPKKLVEAAMEKYC